MALQLPRYKKIEVSIAKPQAGAVNLVQQAPKNFSIAKPQAIPKFTMGAAQPNINFSVSSKPNVGSVGVIPGRPFKEEPQIGLGRSIVKGIQDFTAAANDASFGAAQREFGNLFGIEEKKPTYLASSYDRNSMASKVGSGAGTTGKVVADVASMAIPALAATKVAKGLPIVKNLATGVSGFGRVASKVIPEAAGSLTATGVGAVQDVAKGNEQDLVKNAAIGTGVDLAIPILGRGYRMARRAFGKPVAEAGTAIGEATTGATLLGKNTLDSVAKDTRLTPRKNVEQVFKSAEVPTTGNRPRVQPVNVPVTAERQGTREVPKVTVPTNRSKVGVRKVDPVTTGVSPISTSQPLRQDVIEALQQSKRPGTDIDQLPIVQKATKEINPTIAKEQPIGVDPNDPFGNTSLIQKIRNEAGSLVDDDYQMLALLQKIEKQTGRKGLVDQWHFDTGNVRASNSLANAKLRNSPSLKKAVQGLGKSEIDDFDKYAAARAELKNYDGKQTARSPEENQYIVDQLDGMYGGRYNELNTYYKNLAQEMHAGGLIDDARLQQYLSSDDYIRIQRDMEDLANPRMGSSRARSLGTTKATQKRRGSQREVLSPTQSVAKRTQEIQLEIQRNKAAANTIDVLQEYGLARQVGDTVNKNTISRLVNGKREVFEVPRDIKEVMDNVSPYNLGVIARIISAPARLFRAGTTALSAPFTVTNYLRDQLSSAIYSKDVVATHDPRNIVAGIGSAVRDFGSESTNPLWKKFEEYAGDQTIYDELRNAQNSKRLLRELRQGQTGKLGNMVTAPIRTLEDLNSITEKATRFQNFKGIYEETLRQTGNEEEAIKQAVLAARQNSVDFMRGSSFTRAMNLFIPYFNASIQGTRNVVRSFKDRPLATSMKSVGAIVVPSVALAAYNLSDPQRREVYESLDPYELENNFVLVGPNPVQRDDGSWEGVYKIPKPQGYRELTDPARDMAEAFFKDQPVENVAEMFTDMTKAFTGPIDTSDGSKLVSSLIPTVAKPWIQLGLNKDLYTGSEIVPEFMKADTSDPTKQAFDSTSGIATLIAKQLNVSPIQVEKVITDITGSLGRYGINAVDTGLAAAGVISPDQIGGRSIADDFSRRLFEANGDLLEKNKTGGQKFYDDVSQVSKALNKNEQAAFDTIHPQKTNFLGEEIFNENKRVSKLAKTSAYLQHPAVYEADKELDRRSRERGNPGNPLYDLPQDQLAKVLWKDSLPPGSTDPELSNLYRTEWYQDYQNAKTDYYSTLKNKLAKEGKAFPKSANEYPAPSTELQSAMDAYNKLPKGTGARSGFIKSNPDIWNQMVAQWGKVDNWENKERTDVGLSAIVKDENGNTILPFSLNDGGSSGGYAKGGGGGNGSSSSNSRKYAVSINAGGSIAKPTVKARGSSKGKAKRKYTPRSNVVKATVKSKKSLV